MCIRLSLVVLSDHVSGGCGQKMVGGVVITPDERWVEQVRRWGAQVRVIAGTVAQGGWDGSGTGNRQQRGGGGIEYNNNNNENSRFPFCFLPNTTHWSPYQQATDSSSQMRIQLLFYSELDCSQKLSDFNILIMVHLFCRCAICCLLFPSILFPHRYFTFSLLVAPVQAQAHRSALHIGP